MYVTMYIPSTINVSDSHRYLYSGVFVAWSSSAGGLLK